MQFAGTPVAAAHGSVTLGKLSCCPRTMAEQADQLAARVDVDGRHLVEPTRRAGERQVLDLVRGDCAHAAEQVQTRYRGRATSGAELASLRVGTCGRAER